MVETRDGESRLSKVSRNLVAAQWVRDLDWRGRSGSGRSFLEPENTGFWILCLSGSLVAQPVIHRWGPSFEASGAHGSSQPQIFPLRPLGCPPLPPVPFPSIPSVGSSPDHGAPRHVGRLRSLGNTRGSYGGKTEAFRGLLKVACDFYPSASSPWSSGDTEDRRLTEASTPTLKYGLFLPAGWPGHFPQ